MPENKKKCGECPLFKHTGVYDKEIGNCPIFPEVLEENILSTDPECIPREKWRASEKSERELMKVLEETGEMLGPVLKQGTKAISIEWLAKASQMRSKITKALQPKE